jgi:hypothetical protein
MINFPELTKSKKIEEAIIKNTEASSATCIAIQKSNGAIRHALKKDKPKKS